MRAYTTLQGDTWDLIAFRVYGSELLIPPLLEANEDLNDVVIFSSGQQLAVPDLPDLKQGRNTPPWRRSL